MPFKLACLGIGICLSISSVGLGQVYPQRVGAGSLGQLPFAATGLVETKVGAGYYRGSGAVARDSRLVFTCAHVAFDNGTWASNIGIAPGWNARSDTSNYIPMRGWRFFSNYASSAMVDDESPETFNLDFLVAYRNEPIAPVVEARQDGAPYLTNRNIGKMVVGYPSRRDYDQVDGGFYMHQTGPFTGAYSREYDAYFSIDGASTGTGNSGGPVFENSAGRWILAAILVSGTRNSMGVYSMDSAAWQVSSNALEALGAVPLPNPTPAPDAWGRTPPSESEMNQLLALQSYLRDRMVTVRRIKNPQARSIQLRRLRTMLLQVNARIAGS